MKNFNWASRALAALVHLSGSLAVAAGAAALVFLLWYPSPYAALAGGVGLFVLITSVDVVLGPVITFAIFDRSKPRTELRRDITIVILLQVAALAYGLHTMYLARPVVLALESNRFRVVSANAVVEEEIPMAPAALQKLSLTGPTVIRTEVPTDADEQLEAINKALAGADLGVRPKYWRPWDATARRETLSAGKSLDPLRQRYASRSAELDAAIARTGQVEAQLRYLPILSRFADCIALIDVKTGDVVGFAPFDGF